MKRTLLAILITASFVFWGLSLFKPKRGGDSDRDLSPKSPQILKNHPLPIPSIPIPQAASDPPPSTEATKASAIKSFQELLEAVDKLGEEDEEGLEELHQTMGLAIAKEESQFHHFLERYLPNLEKNSLDRSFFLVNALIHETKSPVPSIEKILTRKAEPFPSSSHQMSPRQLSLVKIYLLSEAVKKSSAWKGTPTATSLLPILLKVAKTDKDLAVTREATRLIGGITSNPEKHFQEILKARPPIEHRAFSDIIQN